MTRKIALVTGAAKRIGRAMALELARMDYDVVVHFSQSEGDALKTVQEIENLGVRAVAVSADLSDPTEAEDLIARAGEAIGGHISVLVNNASVFEEDQIGDVTPASWQQHMAINLQAPVILTQSFAAQDLEAGVIVNMVDQRVRKLTPRFTSYTLSKSALWTFTQTSAQALAPKIRVNAIGPGPTLQGARQEQVHFDAQKAATLMEDGANPDEICTALRYLLQAQAVTGQLLCIDGGQHLNWMTADAVLPE